MRPYATAKPEELTLRDHLARDRTVLANERTLLSYVRTAFGFAAAGGTLLKLFPSEMEMVCLGGGLLAAALVIAIYGVLRFRSVSRGLREMLAPPIETD